MAASHRRSIALLMTLMLVAFLATLGAGLATTASVESIRSARHANDLQHELAVDSALRWFAKAEDKIKTDSTKSSSRNRWFDLVVGDCTVHCRVAYDAAKLDVTAYAGKGQTVMLERKLRDLGRRMDLPDVKVDARPIHKSWRKRERLASYVWFDQLFVDPEVGAYFNTIYPEASESEPVSWSDVVTLWGDGRVDVRYAPDDVLRVVLSDVDRSAAEQIIAARAEGDENPMPRDLDGSIDKQVRDRLTTNSNRYALTLETAIDADRRSWYVVAEVGGTRIRKIHYRGQVRW